jgi:hypothetical protein
LPASYSTQAEKQDASVFLIARSKTPEFLLPASYFTQEASSHASVFIAGKLYSTQEANSHASMPVCQCSVFVYLLPATGDARNFATKFFARTPGRRARHSSRLTRLTHKKAESEGTSSCTATVVCKHAVLAMAKNGCKVRQT